MLQEINIENYKLFKHLKIEGLKRVNLFAGKNNCGKTALLEALRICDGITYIIIITHHILNHRDQNSNDYWNMYDSLFNQKQLEKVETRGLIKLVINDLTTSRDSSGHKETTYTVEYLWEKENINNLKHYLVSPLVPRDRVIYTPFGSTDHFPQDNLWSKISL